MQNNNTVSNIKQIVAMMVDNVVTSNMFNDAFWIEILNEAMSYIYGYHKWSWNVVDESIDVNSSNSIILSYPIQEVILVNDGTNNFTQVQYFSGNGNEFKIDGKNIILDTNYTGQFRIVYRRWFNEYTINDVNKKIDVPFFLNNVLVSLMQFKILPIWLGEGSGGLMNNYLQDAIQQLERYKQIDTYAEVERALYPKRR